jgi:hypothetical protein
MAAAAGGAMSDPKPFFDAAMARAEILPEGDGEKKARSNGHAGNKGDPIPELEIHDAGDIDDETIEPREWVFGTRYCLGFISANIGNGGVGKTALGIVDGLSIAGGRSLTGEHLFRRENVLIVCLEDDKKEIKRRVKAAMQHHRIAPTEVKGRLFYCAHKGEKMMARSPHGGDPVAGQLGSLIRAGTRRYGAKVVVVDPLVKAHALDENNNIDMDAVIDAFVALASEENIAIMLAHHTRKGPSDPGNADTGRGASAVKNGARLVYTTSTMAIAEQKIFALDDDEASALIRLDSAKVNLCPATRAKWFKLVGVKLGNTTDMYPNGDEVQTVEPWTPPDLFAGLSTAKVNAILDQIDRGMPDGRRYSDARAAKERAVWRVVVEHVPEKNEGQAKAITKTWAENGVLVSEPWRDPKRREDSTALRVNPAKRPGPVA